MDDEYIPEKLPSKGKGKGKGKAKAKGKRRASSGELSWYIGGSMTHVIQLDTEDEGDMDTHEEPSARNRNSRRQRKKAKQGELSLIFRGRSVYTLWFRL